MPSHYADTSKHYLAPPKKRRKKPEHSRTKKNKADEERRKQLERRHARAVKEAQKVARRGGGDYATERAKRLARDDAALHQMKNPDNLSKSDVTYRGRRYDSDGRPIKKRQRRK